MKENELFEAEQTFFISRSLEYNFMLWLQFLSFH